MMDAEPEQKSISNPLEPPASPSEKMEQKPEVEAEASVTKNAPAPVVPVNVEQMQEEEAETKVSKNGKAAAPAPPKPDLILHSIPRGKTVPSISPFVLKLETYLRMAGITYEVDTKKPFGSKGKTPWITIEGVDLADSQLIIEFLNKKFEKSLWSNASKEEKAISQSMRIMMEDHLLCGLGEWRWITGINTLDQVMDASGFKFWLLKMYITRRVKNALEIQGIGKHTPEERFHLLKEDIIAISEFLGSKDYFLGNEPTEIDCSVFGVMAQFVWASPGSRYEKVIKEEFPNIEQYCERMKEKFWSDWDSLLIGGGQQNQQKAAQPSSPEKSAAAVPAPAAEAEAQTS